MIDSPKKLKEVKTNMKKKGISDNLLKNVHAPNGLHIGTETPGEIAIAIIGEMLAELYNIKEIKKCSK